MGNGYPGISGGGMGMPGSMTMGSMGGQGTIPPQVTSGSPMGPMGTVVQAPPQQQFEQSYIENILRLNLGKTGTFYMTYENNSQWNAKIFTGVIEAAGRDHIIISERSTGQRIILLTLNLDYITFNEPLIYQYPGVIGNPGQGR
ncbi:spore coat protein GerQ [Paenibacillus sp. HJL G12]|uniref:Spore coat protein GerQ n=2 Tax=Paenibacillus dendrobii TaxID=2691084 RepID=A0A7X3IHV8_9BACL|nr:spore coat protein GerQ [Paenibacillus dendrobii]